MRWKSQIYVVGEGKEADIPAGQELLISSGAATVIEQISAMATRYYVTIRDPVLGAGLWDVYLKWSSDQRQLFSRYLVDKRSLMIRIGMDPIVDLDTIRASAHHQQQRASGFLNRHWRSGGGSRGRVLLTDISRVLSLLCRLIAFTQGYNWRKRYLWYGSYADQLEQFTSTLRHALAPVRNQFLVAAGLQPQISTAVVGVYKVDLVRQFSIGFYAGVRCAE
jgi:hypothetical protein